MATTINHTADGTDEALGADILNIDARELVQLTISVTGAAGSWQINATPATVQHPLNLTSTTELYSWSHEWLDDVRGDLGNFTLKGTNATTIFAITYEVR